MKLKNRPCCPVKRFNAVVVPDHKSISWAARHSRPEDDSRLAAVILVPFRALSQSDTYITR
jgi:hypothetical protein